MAKRLMKKSFKKGDAAVSPIIATLMLVLIAVGSSVAFYVWMNGWQKNITDKTQGGSDTQNSLAIGGSTTAYEFSVYGAQYFEGAHPGYKVSVQKGGSGAGIAAVGTGALDIAGSSEALSSTYTSKYPDLNHDGVKDIGKDLVATTIAYDSVVAIVQTANTHKLYEINDKPLQDTYNINGARASYTNVFAPYVANTPGPVVQWNEFPRHSMVINGGTDATGAIFTAAAGTDATNLAALNVLATEHAYIYVGNGASPEVWSAKALITGVGAGTITVAAGSLPVSIVSPAAHMWVTCADTTDTGTAMKLYDRSDVSGTEDTFRGNFLALPKSGNAQLEDAGVTVNHVDSNQAMVSTISGDASALGFAAYGVAKGNVAMPKLLLAKSDLNNNGIKNEVADIADPNGSSFATQSKTPQTADVNNMLFGGGKRLFYITVGTPQGAVKAYIDFVLAPEMNANICTSGGYFGLY